MNETQYRGYLIKKLYNMFPGCVIVKNDPRQTQGVPDILILYKDKWAMLEIKIGRGSAVQPNQEYYVDMFNGMSFASFINPENEEGVLNDLQQSLGSVGKARIS